MNMKIATLVLADLSITRSLICNTVVLTKAHKPNEPFDLIQMQLLFITFC